MLIDQLCSLLDRGWQRVFSQARSRHRAIRQALAMPCVMGRRTISRTICALGGADRDWSADYKIFSRSQWKADSLFQPVINEYLQRYPKGPITIAFDDTKLAKTGRKIPGTSWQRDPMSPPFHVNFLYGLRFLQASLLFPHYLEADVSARGYPILFREARTVKKPGKRATQQQWESFREARKRTNLSTQALDSMRALRAAFDENGASLRKIIAALDGSFCNKTLFKAAIVGVELLARCRKDARLCFPAPSGSRRKYSEDIFTPEQVRQANEVHWQKAKVFFGGRNRMLRYKELKGVLWKRGAGTRPLRLIVIAPVPYKISPHSRTNYREPAYLLSTDLRSSAKRLVQSYFDRWQIEVNHRDEKDIIGVGQAQVWSEQSVPRHPAFVVACYSLLLLAALREFGPTRTDHYLQLPAWRKNSKRPSFLDILTRLRNDLNEAPVSHFLPPFFSQNLARYAGT